LKALGIDRIGTLLTRDRSESCSRLDKGMADALFVVEEPKRPTPRLGVATNPEPGGLRIGEIMAGSVAESAGLQKGDLITEIAGQPAKSILTLRQAVQRQPPGTLLPITVKRGEAEIQILARFPAEK
jgi:S1-C subfamily serine protease